MAFPRFAIALSLLLCVGGAAAKQEAPQKSISKKTYDIVRAAAPIRIDGDLSDSAWASATRVSLDYEWSPGDNTTPPVRTEAFITYDHENLYFGFRAFDPDPSQIRAHIKDRDRAFADDTVGFMIDPFNDERRGFQFRINPLGVQMDAVNSDVDGSEDWSWDAIWSSVGKVTSDGYVVEVAIPFKSLRFQDSDKPQTWGFIVMRDYPRIDRHRMQASRRDRNLPCLVCQFDKLAGFEGIRPGRNFELDPTLTSHAAESRPDFDTPFDSAQTDTQFGLTGRWGITPNVTANVAVNPDFSQVEADAAQLDVNTQFALYYPEKRPFFLEGADFFSTPLQVVFTRTIADPAWGAKVSGKEGQSAFGAFIARDRINNLVLPSLRNSSLTSSDDSLSSGVLRYRRDIGKTSTVGLLYTDREGGDYHNRLAGIDGTLRFTSSDSLRFQAVQSSTKYPEAIVNAFAQPQGSFDGNAYLALYEHTTRNWYWQARYKSLDPQFRADSGFITQVDYRQAVGMIQRTFWGTEKTPYQRIEISAESDRREDHTGKFVDDGSDFQLKYFGRHQLYAELTVSPNRETYGGHLFNNPRQSIYLEMRPSGSVYLWTYARSGKTIDFANARQAELRHFEDGGEFAFGRHLESSVSLLSQTLYVTGGRLFTARIGEVHGIYNFNVRSFVRLIAQYTSVDRNPLLYADAVSRKSDHVFTQALFSYKLNPQSVILLGYSDNYFGNESYDVQQTDRTLFLKLGYAWVM